MARFCAECGTELPEGARFCPECGFEVSGQTRGESKPSRKGRRPGQGGRRPAETSGEGWLGPYTTPVLIVIASTVAVLIFIGLQNRGGQQGPPLQPGPGVTGGQQQADVQQQIQQAQRQLLQDPDDQGTIEHLAHLYFDSQNYEQAVTYYRRALEAKPESPELRTDLGTALNRLGQKQAAIQEFQRVVEYAPDFVTAKFNIAVVNEQIGNTSQALEWYRRVARESPNTTLGQRAASQVEALGGGE